METKHRSVLISVSCIVLILTLVTAERLTLPKTTSDMITAAELHLSANSKETPSNAFNQDGCSLFIDSFFSHDFSEACLAHDIRYWAGGPAEERKLADIALRRDIAHTGPIGPVLAPIMYMGVRIFGDSFITKAVGANWGYGWNK